jgi:hypothetical protein
LYTIPKDGNSNCRQQGILIVANHAGCQELREAMIQNIAWDQIPWTASPRIFKQLKEAILKLRDEGHVLLRMAELRQHLELRLPRETFTADELRAVVGLLAGPGVVWQLEFGDFILLRPELINVYAAAVIRKVRARADEIGCIPEEDVLKGQLDYQDMKRIPPEEETIVLRAMQQTFVEHGLCLREPGDSGSLLIFPSYFKRERPELVGHPAAFVSYQFNGPIEEIYATLVVRLHHTTAFEKDRLWRLAADFRTQQGKRVGLKMIQSAEGSSEITVYCDPDVPDDTKVTFNRYIHNHLEAKAKDVIRLRHYVCPKCDTPVLDRRTALNRLNRGLKDVVCINCENRVLLWDLIEQKFASEELQRRVRELEEQSRDGIDNESRELRLVGDAMAIAAEAGQIFRQIPNSDWGIDAEIEFKDFEGNPSGQRVYLQLKSGDSHLTQRNKDKAEVFQIKSDRLARYWQHHRYPVMLVIRTSDGTIRWMDVSAYLKKQTQGGRKPVRQVIFYGEPYNAISLQRMRDRLVPPPP